MSSGHDPETLEEWRAAAADAAGLRLVHDAKLYGLIEGGPEIDVDRVDEILDRARELGIVITRQEAEHAALAFVAAAAAEAAAQ